MKYRHIRNLFTAFAVLGVDVASSRQAHALPYWP